MPGSKAKVFLAWSGDLSGKVAQVLRKRLPEIIKAISPFKAPWDIGPGKRWASEVAAELASSDFGVLCLTPSNLQSEWVNFEAGALSKHLGEARVCPFLLGVHPSELEGPLNMFQVLENTKRDLFRLVAEINGSLPDLRITKSCLKGRFARVWPRLSKDLRPLQEAALTNKPWAQLSKCLVTPRSDQPPFELKSFVEQAKHHIVIAGQNLFVLATAAKFANAIQRFLSAGKGRNRCQVLMCDPEDEHAVPAWRALFAEKGDYDYTKHLNSAWRKFYRMQTRWRGLKIGAFRVRVTALMPVGMIFIDPDDPRSAVLVLRPIVPTADVSAERPQIIIRKTDSEAAFTYYWSKVRNVLRMKGWSRSLPPPRMTRRRLRVREASPTIG